MPVHVVPTLAHMAAIYRLPRDGGPRSERFKAYVPLARTVPGLPAYNPMAGDRARTTVEELLALDAEHLAAAAAGEVAQACGYAGAIELAVVVASPGMWTDRLATEIQSVTSVERSPGQGMVTFWSGEEVTAAGVEGAARGEVVRVMRTALHAAPRTLGALLEREGLALAAGPSAQPLTEDEGDRVRQVLADHWASTEPGVVAAALFGDEAASQMGWQTLGVCVRGGLRWGAAQARARVAAQGLRGAVTTSGWLTPPR